MSGAPQPLSTCKRQKAAPTTEQDAIEALEYVLSRGQQVFAYLHYRIVVHDKQLVADPDALIVLKNAALESSLMSIRSLNEFFESKDNTAHPDNVFASHFNFPDQGPFLSDEEENSIHKNLAHVTAEAGRKLRQDPFGQNPRRWRYAELVNKAMESFGKFMTHLETSGLPITLEQRNLIEATRSAVAINLQALAALAEADRNQHADVDVSAQPPPSLASISDH